MKLRGTRNTERQEWELDRDATVRLHAGPGGVVVRAVRGTVLVTREGDLEDHVLEAGETLLMTGKGLVVAWALAPAFLTVEHAPRGLLPGAHQPARAAA